LALLPLRMFRQSSFNLKLRLKLLPWLRRSTSISIINQLLISKNQSRSSQICQLIRSSRPSKSMIRTFLWLILVNLVRKISISPSIKMLVPCHLCPLESSTSERQLLPEDQVLLKVNLTVTLIILKLRASLKSKRMTSQRETLITLIRSMKLLRLMLMNS
jgi:hypothetical protein